MTGFYLKKTITLLNGRISYELECRHVNSEYINNRDEIWCYYNNNLIVTFSDMRLFKQWLFLTTGEII